MAGRTVFRHLANFRCLKTKFKCHLPSINKTCLPSQCVKNFHDDNVKIHHNERQQNTVENLTEYDMKSFFHDIKTVLDSEVPILRDMCYYYFDATGKSFRPKIIFLMARACNISLHECKTSFVSQEQRKIAMIAEMIHSGSLIHDDVVDVSNTRRGKDSVNKLWGDRNAILAGNYVLSRSSHLLASIGNTEVVKFISTIIDDLVRVESISVSDAISHRVPKTEWDYLCMFENLPSVWLVLCVTRSPLLLLGQKAASGCAFEPVALLSEMNGNEIEAMYQYGRNVGIAFQLIDDLLDISQTTDDLGKPANADLRLGLATAPVLFAAEKHPFLNSLILRRFSKPGDVERTLEAVKESDGLQETRLLANQYSNDAKRYLAHLEDSEEKEALLSIATAVVERVK